MIRGIGIDSVELSRCILWNTYSAIQLERIFSPQEIAYCFDHTPSTTQRFAARFAAKEASYKAVCAAFPDLRIPFLTFCKASELIHTPSAPILSINWSYLQQYSSAIKPLICHVSLTHTRTQATALVIMEL
jgi:holo-[acyl-carrier protein] synthase